ncbi:hypothetical protein GEMRC1_012628 [Eukaryota sp. GEM-RC1]
MLSYHSVTESYQDVPLYASINFPESILVQICNHMTGIGLKRSYGDYYDLQSMRLKLFCLFQKVGFVSLHFFKTTHISNKVFIESNSFYVHDTDLAQLLSFVSFFNAEVQSIFLNITSSDFEHLPFRSNVVTGLRLNKNYLHYLNNFNFLNSMSHSSFSCLKFLDCSHNSIYSGIEESNVVENILALAQTLKFNSTIIELNLCGNLFGDEGVTALAEALKINSSITNIDLSTNSIGPIGAVALADVLKVNSTITQIDLSNNFLEDEGAMALSEALKINSTVTKVYVSSLYSLEERMVAHSFFTLG